MTAWARPYTLGTHSHNLNIERYHRTIKLILKPNFNIACFAIALGKVNKMFCQQELMVREEIRGIGSSKIHGDFSRCHPKSEEMQSYSVERKSDGFDIIRKDSCGQEVKRYFMGLNRFPCTISLCQVRCVACANKNICAHLYTCECKQYAYR